MRKEKTLRLLHKKLEGARIASKFFKNTPFYDWHKGQERAYSEACRLLEEK